jgi:hypothetical protein
LAGEEIPCPGEGETSCSASRTGSRVGARWLWLVGFIFVAEGVGVLLSGGRGGRGTEVATLGVVFASTSGVREGVVGVVDELEFPRAGGPFWGFGWDAVRVGFQGGLLVGVTNLGGCRTFVYFEDGV